MKNRSEIGNCLEPDSWNPCSSPYTTYCTLAILEELGGYPIPDLLIKKVLGYLEQELKGSRSWNAVIPSNNDYPRAPWWSWLEEGLPSWGFTPTAYLCGWILAYAKPRNNGFTS